MGLMALVMLAFYYFVMYSKNNTFCKNGCITHACPNGTCCSAHQPKGTCNKTRFGPTRPAADMEGSGEYHFWVIFSRIFGDILDDFWRIFEEFWRNFFVVRRLRTSINRSPTKKMRFCGHCGLQTALELRSDLRF